jgi:mannose-6-phosphate isomerase-like protein (cupin superfamily)
MSTIAIEHAVTAPGAGEVLKAGGSRLIVRVATPSQFVCEYSAPPRYAGPPMHVHPGFDETFLILQGRLQVTVRDEPVELTAGGTAYVSGSVPHTFRNPDAERTRFLLICTPGGMEDYFRGIASGNAALVAAAAERVGYRPVAEGAQ